MEAKGERGAEGGMGREELEVEWEKKLEVEWEVRTWNWSEKRGAGSGMGREAGNGMGREELPGWSRRRGPCPDAVPFQYGRGHSRRCPSASRFPVAQM